MQQTVVFWLGVGFAGGILLQGCAWGPAWLPLAVIGFCLLLAWRLLRRTRRMLPLVAALALLGGFCFTTVRAARLPAMLDESWQDETVRISGCVDGFPLQDAEGAWQLSLNDLTIIHNRKSEAIPGRLQVYFEAGILLQPAPGDLLQAEGKLSVSSGRYNFGDPDWQLQNHRRGMIGRIYVSKTGFSSLQPTEQVSLIRSIWQIRHSIYRQMTEIQANGRSYLQPEQAAFLLGLTIGVTDELPEEWYDSFQVAGLLHLLAVSGGNVVIFLAGIRWLLRRLPLPLNLEYCFSMLAVIFFMLLTGLEDSVLRAGTMIILALLARLILRRTQWPSLLALTALLLCLQNPFILYEAGFQLSFAAVAGILLWSARFAQFLQLQLHLPNSIALTLAVTLAAQTAVLPLSIQLFNQISLIAPLSNLVFAVFILPAPFLVLLLVCLTPLGPAAAAWAYAATHLYIGVLVKIGGFFAGLPFAAYNIATPGWPAVAFSYAVLLLLSAWPFNNGKISRKAVAAAALTAVMLWIWHPWPYAMEMVMLDVGQGEALFFRFSDGHTMLIDGGGSASGESSVGKKAVVPFLRRQGIQQLDVVLLTHAHGDHYQGLIQVNQVFPFRLFLHALPENAVLPQDLQQWLSRAQAEQQIGLAKGDRIRIAKECEIEVKLCGVNQDGGNEDSVVLRLQYGETVIWLTGDIEAAAEQQLLATVTAEKAAVVLKVAHHGGTGSSSAQLLAAWQPDIAVISAGRNNSYGHPAEETVNRLAKAAAAVYATNQVGAIRLRSDGRQWTVTACLARE
ncbi:MAG: DNA internalization-related competence protein ComEC/Rec2 [Negativicutes bacterium]|nr:DNA internalization-related competence protein ComEC/Rec2 [Negativicutes bacterium]